MIEHDAVGFCRALRSAGVAVPVGSTVTYIAGLGVIDLDRADSVYWTGRATLLRRPEDIPIYDEVFSSWYLGREHGGAAPSVDRQVEIGFDDGDDEQDDAGHEDADGEHRPDQTVRFSRVERLAERDFATCTDEELQELWAAIAMLRWAGHPRRSRRLRAGGNDGPLDLRRTLRASLPHQGEVLERHHRRRKRQPRRVVLLIDISGSMEPYARALLRFAHAAVLARRRVEVFSMGTRLTRLTRQLGVRDADAALAAAAAEVPDWSGGTRLGEALGTFLDQWGQRGMARGAEVVVLSDGWDRGDPTVLADQMARLGRLAHRIIWVNPLRASPGYAPLAQGMAAALPYCDHFVDGHSLRSLVELGALLESGDR
jgi:uncharacterized protein with von Willebrand factor type A (vWA) domain